MVERGALSLAIAWDLISHTFAAAMKLVDRGVIELERRAGIVVLDCAGPWRLVHTIVDDVMTSLKR